MINILALTPNEYLFIYMDGFYAKNDTINQLGFVYANNITNTKALSVLFKSMEIKYELENEGDKNVFLIDFELLRNKFPKFIFKNTVVRYTPEEIETYSKSSRCQDIDSANEKLYGL